MIFFHIIPPSQEMSFCCHEARAFIFLFIYLIFNGIHLFVTAFLGCLITKTKQKKSRLTMILLKTTSRPAKQKLISYGHSDSLFLFPAHRTCFTTNSINARWHDVNLKLHPPSPRTEEERRTSEFISK
jgi:hypothetical protein